MLDGMAASLAYRCPRRKQAARAGAGPLAAGNRAVCFARAVLPARAGRQGDGGRQRTIAAATKVFTWLMAR